MRLPPKKISPSRGLVIRRFFRLSDWLGFRYSPIFARLAMCGFYRGNRVLGYRGVPLRPSEGLVIRAARGHCSVIWTGVRRFLFGRTHPSTYHLWVVLGFNAVLWKEDHRR